jgi:transcriptional regulator with XRE-family HTH domain
MGRPDVVLWHIGDVVRKVREMRGLSRKEVASSAGIRQNTLGELERNVSNFERETLAKVAIALNITVDGLYAQLPGVTVPAQTDPTDTETIARFLTLNSDQKDVVRRLVDQFGLFADRRQQMPDQDNATQHAGPIPRKSP